MVKINTVIPKDVLKNLSKVVNEPNLDIFDSVEEPTKGEDIIEEPKEEPKRFDSKNDYYAKNYKGKGNVPENIQNMYGRV